MATANAKTQCFSCRKEISTFKCEGCSKNFCRNDLTIHLQKLSEELDGIEYDHDQFRQEFNEQKEDPKKRSLIRKVDQWEKESINKIKQTAEQCRQELNNYTNKFLIKMENKLNDIAKELKQVRQENEFNEIDLNQFKQKLNKLKEQLDKPSNVSIEQESSTFIQKISILQFDEGDETDVVHVDEPKQKRPFAEMPKRSFNMDEFKRVYSNEDTAGKALPYFWKNFDKENLSIWFCEYKYPEDLTQIFMSCNLVSGFFQRLDKLRKNAFGSMCIFGENNNNTITGVWFWRGQELAFLLSPDWQIDYESFSWKKLSPDDENTKKLVNQYFLWEGEHDGKKFNQGKIFK